MSSKMNVHEYQSRQIEEQQKLLREAWRNPPSGLDKDIFNLKFMLLDIRPYSRAWRRGYVHSLRMAIKALEYLKGAKNG